MALGPDAVEKKLMREVERTETYIDQELAKSRDSRGITIGARVLPCTDSWVIKEIVRRYKAAGWKNVEYVYDQRDGDFLSIKN